jgi:hypothetical protein
MPSIEGMFDDPAVLETMVEMHTNSGLKPADLP